MIADMEEFYKRRTLLEMWRSCCDGNRSLCVSAKTFRLELTSEFGGNLRLKHPDVSDKGRHNFTLLRKIIRQLCVLL